MFKIKDVCKLELQMSEKKKFFGRTRKVVLVQWDLLDNQNQQQTGLLYTFTPNKCYAYWINIEPSDLVFLKTYNT